MKKKKETVDETYEKLYKFMHPRGMKCGNEISRILKKKDNISLPLYRGALVITPQKNGTILLETYHDPHWLGNEINKRTVKEFKDNQSILIQGQRSMVDIWYNTYRDTAIKISDLPPEDLIKLAKQHEKDMNKWMKNLGKKRKKIKGRKDGNN